MACPVLASNSLISQRTGHAFWKFQRASSVLPSGPSATTEPLRRAILFAPEEAISSRHLKRPGSQMKPLVSTRLEALVGPISLRTVSLSPPSWYSKTSLSLFSPPHLRNEALSIESISTRKKAMAWWSLRAALPISSAPADRTPARKSLAEKPLAYQRVNQSSLKSLSGLWFLRLRPRCARASTGGCAPR